MFFRFRGFRLQLRRDRPRRPKMASRWPKMAPRWPQDGPKRGPRRPKTGPRRAQDGSKSHLIAILCCIIFVFLKITPPRPPKTASGAPRDPMRRPRGPPRDPMGPSWEAPGTPRDGPRRLREGPKTPRDGSNIAKMAAKTATYDSFDCVTIFRAKNAGSATSHAPPDAPALCEALPTMSQMPSRSHLLPKSSEAVSPAQVSARHTSKYGLFCSY